MVVGVAPEISHSEIDAWIQAGCEAVFLPADPPRLGRVAFYLPDAATPAGPSAGGSRDPASEDSHMQLAGPPGADASAATVLTVVRQHGKRITRDKVTALALPISAALPVLKKVRLDVGQYAHPDATTQPPDATAQPPSSIAFWGAAAVEALRLVAQGKLLPGVSAGGYDAWRVGPIDAQSATRLTALAAAMPMTARAVPIPDITPITVPSREPHLRAFLDAVADTLARPPGAQSLTANPLFASPQPQPATHLRPWVARVATGRDQGLEVSLRIEFPEESWDHPGHSGDSGALRCVVQVRSLSNPTAVADAKDMWSGNVADLGLFGPQPHVDLLLALRRAAHVWAPAARFLDYASLPDAIDLSDDDVHDLLGDATARLAGAGVVVHWPKDLVRALTAEGVIEHKRKSTTSAAASLLGDGAMFKFRWQVALGDQELTEAELEQLVAAHRPIVRLRDQWVVVDAGTAKKLKNAATTLTAIDALGAALTGTLDIAGRPVTVKADKPLTELSARLANPEPPSGELLDPPAALHATLRPYQLRGFTWLDRMTSLGLGVCLADDMGLGKTITLISLHLLRQQDPVTARPTLVVCPASLLGNWEREIRRFAPGTPVARYHGPGRQEALAGLLPDGAAPVPQTGADAGTSPAGDGFPEGREPAGPGAPDSAGPGAPIPAGFVLTTYGTMRRDVEQLGAVPWGLLVADEAQHAKNPHSSTAQGLRRIPSQSRVALTGTPVENNLTELWSLLDWTTPGLLGKLTPFRARYAKPIEGVQDPQVADRLSKLIRPFLLRRRKSDPGIAPELPPKTETDQPVSLTPEQVSLYEAVVRETMAQIEEAAGIARRGLVLKLLTGLKQVCNHPAQFLKEPPTARLAGRSGKLELLDELLDTIIAEDGSALLFTQYVSMGTLLERHLSTRGIGTQFLHGGTPVKRREQMVDAFQSGQSRVFLLSLKAAGTGLNLTRAGHVIHYDRWWNPAVEDQATDRAYRIGQTQAVQVHKLIAEGTVEDKVAQMLVQKRELADAVLGQGEAAFSELSNAELFRLVALRGAGSVPQRSATSATSAGSATSASRKRGV